MNPSEQPGTLAQRMRHTPYQAYSYSYPHKAAYRALPQAAPLAPLWAQQDRSALFAYIHIPFCDLRFYDCCAAERGASPLTTKKRGPAFSDGLLLGVVAIVGVGQG